MAFTGEYLFENVSFTVGNNDRIGLTGKNGSGKSTLLKILSKIYEPSGGTIVVSSGHKIGYLQQEFVPSGDKTVWNETLSAFAEANQLQEQMQKMTADLSERTDYESEEYARLASRLSEASDRFRLIGGYTMEADTERVLRGLGFSTHDLSRNMTEFSTGWQMRVQLAKLLLVRPEVLLLDEPTNHLDIESIQWLEDYLSEYNGAVILVSHDRAFLDRITTRTIEISLGKIYDYKCNYSEFVIQRAERIRQQQAAFDNQQREIEHIEAFIERFRYKATKAKQVQSRIKLLEKMDRIEVDDTDNSKIHFMFPEAVNSGKVVVELENIRKDFPQKTVLHDVNYVISRSERIAFVGRNGEGKTTLSKMIVGELEPTEGKIKLGHNVSIGYYAQNQAAMLNPDKTVFETIDDVAVGEIRKNIRNILGSFLFGSEDIEKKVKVLSGGEKARLALAKLLLTPHNTLLLDEPTNHLDMVSKDVLKTALLQFKGTLIIVSHDRDFLQGLTDKVLEFRNHSIKEYVGDVYDFLEKRKLETLNDLNRNTAKNTTNDKTATPPTDSKAKYKEKKELEARLRQLKNALQRKEEAIAMLEEQQKLINDKLARPQDFQREIADGSLSRMYAEIQTQLENEMAEWEKIAEELDSLKKS